FQIELPSLVKYAVIKNGQVVELLLRLGSMRFLSREFNQLVQTPAVSVLQERVQQHRTKRRREGQCDARVQPVFFPTLEQLQQRDIGLGNGLEQPAFFEKTFMFRMANEGQMCMQDKREITLHQRQAAKQRGAEVSRDQCSALGGIRGVSESCPSARACFFA